VPNSCEKKSKPTKAQIKKGKTTNSQRKSKPTNSNEQIHVSMKELFFIEIDISIDQINCFYENSNQQIYDFSETYNSH